LAPADVGVNDAPVAVNAIGRWGAQNAQLCVMKMARGPDWRTVHNGGYLRTAPDQRQLQNVTASLGLHGGLRGRHAAVTAGYHLSKRHWNTATLDGSVANAEVLELIGHAYDLWWRI
jgi:hypothetical protein